MVSPLKTYAFINAKLRTRISRLLSDEFLRQMARAPSLPEAIQLLRDTPFEPIEATYRRTGDLKMGELELFRREVALHLEIEALVEDPVRPFVRALTDRYEVDKLKDALRLWFDRRVRGRSIQSAVGYLYRGKIHHDLDPDAVINMDSLADIAGLLERTPYAGAVLSGAGAAMERSSLFPIEIGLDQLYYRRLLESTRELDAQDREIAVRLIGVEIDLQNIDWIVRFRSSYDLTVEEALRYLIPYGRNIDAQAMRSAYTSGGLTDLLGELVRRKYDSLRPLLSAQGPEVQSRLVLVERILDQILALEVRHALTGFPFSIGIILAYFILKTNETKRIMTILNAKYYNIPQERIEGLL